MVARPKLNNTAAPQVAGYILQLERALFHLSKASANAAVAIEYVDDVVVLRENNVVVQEQDKHSVRATSEVLSDRSKALWRTLQIWVTQRKENTAPSCQRYLIVTNTTVTTRIAKLLKAVHDGHCSSIDVVSALREAGKSKSKTQLQKIIDDVLSHSDKDLKGLVECIEIIDGIDPTISKLEIANGFAIHPRMDHQAILDNLLGWLTRTLREMWADQKPGLISRAACVTQCREIEALQARRRLLPRAASEGPVRASDRKRALSRPFVEHLTRIDSENEDIYQAIEHFLQFSTEKYRLAAEGEVADSEWSDRSGRLRQRWLNILRKERRKLASATPQELGQEILAHSTYEHYEPLGGYPCEELYMTAGHYHRLADEDHVWWDPTYKPG